MNREKRRSSLENALRLLKQFSIEKPEYGVQEIAQKIGVANSTAHRLLTTLAEEGFVAKDHHTNAYRLSVSFLSLQAVITSHNQLYNLSAPILKKLAQESMETAVIAVLNRNQVFYLNKADCENRLFAYQTHVGQTHPLNYSAAGFVLLGSEQIQKQGYATTVHPIFPEITTIAAPVLGADGQVVAAIELVGPTQRMNPSRLPLLIRQVKQAALELTNRLAKKLGES